MYRYDEFDARIVAERVAQFRGQVERRLDGRLTEEQFRPLRLMNGLYLQLHAYMLRVAVPYGTLNSAQFRQLAMIAEKYDRGYAHVTTRQNLQYNWPELEQVPDILNDLAKVEMHAFQTSGNCIRNVTSDPYAGATSDEVEDPRPTAELLRQWSTLHPEFSFLPRKFKIAVTGCSNDRAVIRAHDIGIEIVERDGEVGYHILVGGGLGRTPIIGQTLNAFLSKDDLLPYLEATMRVYNRYGRRDNKYKARIKILVQEEGIETFRAAVEKEYATLTPSDIAVSAEERDRIAAYFAPPQYADLPATSDAHSARLASDSAYKSWAETNLATHRQPGYAIVNISLKPLHRAPGDIDADQMRSVADLAEQFSFDELRTTHQQNLVLPHVKLDELPTVYDALVKAKLADGNLNLISDIICCPGMDFCALATARSIPIAQAIHERFADPARQQAIGEFQIKISGCINACGHHHVGHIGILGLEKAGVEFYQVKLGGDASEDARLGDITGPGFSETELIDGIERLVETYIDVRSKGERFIDTYKRLGLAPFKEALYA
jgi:sulfite reductase (NADPH) hemoprotein beta-component